MQPLEYNWHEHFLLTTNQTAPLCCLKLSSKLKCVTCRILVSSHSTVMRLILSLTPAVILTKSITPLGDFVTKENQNNISWRKNTTLLLYLNSDFSLKFKKKKILTDDICSAYRLYRESFRNLYAYLFCFKISLLMVGKLTITWKRVLCSQQ